MTDFRTTNPPAFSLPPFNPPAPRRENFPVASRLLPRRLRGHILAFYRFVRLADDVADDPYLDPDAKLAYLTALERALTSGRARQPLLSPAVNLHDSLVASGSSDLHVRQLLQAFRQDAIGSSYKTWGDLIGYCRLSAMPVGRYLLELHGEDDVLAGESADSLCAALQILNHVQDCRDDWINLGRCYLPQCWFDAEQVSVERLVEQEADARIRGVLDRVLDHTDDLLAQAKGLPGLLNDRGLAMEAAVIWEMGAALAQRLRREDPLARRVGLGTLARIGAVWRGVFRTIRVRRRPLG